VDSTRVSHTEILSSDKREELRAKFAKIRAQSHRKAGIKINRDVQQNAADLLKQS
jgi:hypothetical protein